MSRSEREKMLSGELYRPSDAEIQAELAATSDWLARYNVSAPPARRDLLLERFGGVGIGAEIRPPFFCDYGSNIYIGAGAFLNFNCVILDVARV
jgi:maltose O-acetyltransferase